MFQNQPKQKEVTKWYRTNLNNNYKQEITWIFFNIQVNFTSIRVSKFHKKGNITYKVMKSQSTTAPMLLSMEEQKSFWGSIRAKCTQKAKVIIMSGYQSYPAKITTLNEIQMSVWFHRKYGEK